MNHRRVDAIGYVFDAVVYFFISVGALSALILRVDAKTAVPWASPWRTRSPKLLAVAGPVLFILAFPVSLTGLPAWVAAAMVFGALAAPPIGAALVLLEWLRRRAEDRATGLVRPERPLI